MDQDQEEHRRFNRILFDSDIQLIGAGGSWRSKIIDISLQGALIRLPEGWEGGIGEQYVLELPLDNDDAVIRMETSVIHIEDEHVGLHCDHIDLDSITHLRRLVELNLGDAAELERELSALGR